MLEVIVQTDTGAMFDISQLVTSIKFEDNIRKSGILNCSVLEDEAMKPSEGNIIRVKYDNEVYFLGYIFKLSYTAYTEYGILAYDPLRYLKANETYVFENVTASSALTQICGEFKLPTGQIEDTRYILPRMIFDDKCILDILADILTVTLRNTGELFILKSNDGKIELKNIKNTITDFVVDPESTLLEYSFDRSIDDDTYNQIKLIRDNKDTGKREIYIAKDSETIQKWGLLQYYEKVDDGLNAAQIRDKVNGLLSLKNRVLKTLTGVRVLGDARLRAGHMVFLNLPKRGIYGYLLCTKATHNFTNDAHTVTADFKLI